MDVKILQTFSIRALSFKTFSIKTLSIAAILLLSACASVPVDQRVQGDPWESYNRSMFKFNKGLDRTILKPVATGYKAVMPNFAETGVSNFFSNLGDVPNAFNNLLQGKFKAAGSDTLRFLSNSTIGLVGLFDIASTVGLEKHSEDFGQTLATWGVPAGPYFMLPVLGPSTVRGTGGLVVDRAAIFPQSYIEDDAARLGLTSIELVDTRAGLLKIEDLTGTQLYDDYAQMRDMYLKRREVLIHDGNQDDSAEENELRRELEDLDG